VIIMEGILVLHVSAAAAGQQPHTWPTAALAVPANKLEKACSNCRAVPFNARVLCS
jgi:hypothetical protein